ncbi:hypothetical protein GOP47_0009632 [Adiantum capillus-veneris]|uniref:NB-ARC domain-containing protein n=1 Tax=Adiantum capillus-veneris TaxID=13818 RepID=A0A9D4UX01_ADICA|nr:hypothetical protein GOP47_0009632 [Adiantum capillus-veneris]
MVLAYDISVLLYDMLDRLHQESSLDDQTENFIAALSDGSILEQAERNLQSLLNQIVVVGKMLQVVRTTCSENVGLPLSEEGLRSGTAVLEFLNASQGQDFRVIAIHGQRGSDATTLLNHIWQNVSEQTPFCARAYVQIGCESTLFTICKYQSNIVWQLDGQNKDFSSKEYGKEILNELFEEMKTQNRPFFLAMDDVCEVEDLQNILPHRLGRENLPSSTCIALTCSNGRVVEALLRICNLQEHDCLRVCMLESPYIELEEGKRLFAKCAGMQHGGSDHQELLDALVPLCAGLPLAITVLGKVFADERKRKRREWHRIVQELATFDDKDDGDTLPVRKALQLSFDSLGESCKIAFLDIVSTFHGWWWERVERIVDSNILRDLVSSFLIFKVDAYSMYNQSTLREGYDLLPHSDCKGFVAMHDLTFRFGESLLRSGTLGYKQYVMRPLDELQGLKVSELRHLILSSDSLDQKLLQDARNLQMLVLLSHDGNDRNQAPSSGEPGTRSTDAAERFFQATHFKETSEPGTRSTDAAERFFQATHFKETNDTRQLCILLLVSQSIKEMKFLHGVRELMLQGCGDLVQLPDTPLRQLESLHIIDCPELQGFSTSCVKEWWCLKSLTVAQCPKLTLMAAELGSLPALKEIRVFECNGLLEFPSLRNSNGLSSLMLQCCSRLEALGDLVCQLQSLTLHYLPVLRMFNLMGASVTALTSLTIKDCQALENLPAAALNASSLKRLEISSCGRLVTLLPDVEIGNMTSLTEVIVEYCSEVRRLPAGILNASSLEKLKIQFCGSLVDLIPHGEVSNMTSLKELSIGQCPSLSRLLADIFKKASSLQKLQIRCNLGLVTLPAELCMLTSLVELDLMWCEELVELPQQIGSLCSLKILNLGECSSLQRLPDSTSSLVSLEQLCLDHCNSLMEVPQQLGGLSSFKELVLREALPDPSKLLSSFCSITSLERLYLHRCQHLVQLPELEAGLHRLILLHLYRCEKLVKIPDSFVSNILSLESLMVDCCNSLTDLPKQIGDLRSLKELVIKSGKKLEKLPDSICNIASLERLVIDGYLSLKEFPEQIHKLCSLKELTVRRFKDLIKLPSSICNIASLEKLTIVDCKNLMELPEQIGDLSSLKLLSLQRCMKIEKLPGSICNIASLEKLSINGCESLMELPEQIGNLSSLKEINLARLKLKELPESICNITSLKVLELNDWEGVREFARGLKALREITSSNICSEVLNSICNISSLQTLSVINFKSELVELPEQISRLCALRALKLDGCRKLRKLPDSICSIGSLQCLSLESCRSLEELPPHMGDLSSLQILNLLGCRELRQIPDSIYSLRSLCIHHEPNKRLCLEQNRFKGRAGIR